MFRSRKNVDVPSEAPSDLRRLTSLAAFIGHVCRAYPDMELTALLQYLVNQLRASESHDLVVLKELISTMTVRVKPV